MKRNFKARQSSTSPSTFAVDLSAVNHCTARELPDGGAVVARVTVKNKRTGAVVRTFHEPPYPGTSDYWDGEYAAFLDYGEYTAVVSDELLLGERGGGVKTSDSLTVALRCHPKVHRSIGVCVVDKRDLDAKTALVTLSWADMPMDLDLCVRSADGVLSGGAAAAGAGGAAATPMHVGGGGQAKAGTPAFKGLKYESTAVGGYKPGTRGGYGPKVISFAQPMAGKFKVYVMARDERVSFAKCSPVVTMATFEGVHSFRLKLPTDVMDAELERPDEGPPCWHVFDLKVETDSKWSDCYEITEVNKLLPAEVAEA